MPKNINGIPTTGVSETKVENDGLFPQVPSLSKALTEKRTFLEYEAPKIYDENDTEIIGARDRWLEIVDRITEDLKWLLKMPFYKFWSNVLFNQSISECLVSCLQESPTFYNIETFPNDAAMRASIENLRHIVFVTCARFVISKASKEEFMPPEVHGNILYDNFLLTIPMMLDICQIYGRENTKVVTKMLSTAIKLQPLYKHDFEEMAIFITQVFKTVHEKFEDGRIPLATGAIPLTECNNRILTNDDLEDLIVHLLDVSSNISIFLDCYEPAADLFSNENFVNEIVRVYGNTILEMYRKLEPLALEDITVAKYTDLKHLLDTTRIELIKIFRTVTYHNIARIMEEPNPSKAHGVSEYVEEFVTFLEAAVAEREFLLDYHAIYPIDVDLDLVSQISHDVDPVKQEYILTLVYGEFLEDDSSKRPTQPTINNVNANAPIPSGSQTVTIPVSSDNRNDKAINGASSKDPAELVSLISEVKDILCDLGEGFIERCLRHYNYDSAAVLNAVFEDTLPESLKSLDRMLPYIPPDPAEASAAIDAVLGSERLNVFDNDEFDIMTRDSIDQSRVHKGKRKDKYKNFNQLLDDKTYRKDIDHIYNQYSVIQDEYEDEYDDTYDGHEIGPRGVDEPLEMDGRAFTTPRVLRWNDKREVDNEEEEEEEDTQQDETPSRGQNDRVNFVQDPAELRARAEQRALSKRGGGAGGSSRGPQNDLVGKPKGQGNDKSVLVNRDRKNTNKASRGNHNRRRGADFKRRQGMVP